MGIITYAVYFIALKGGVFMETSMEVLDVVEQIKQLKQNGNPLNKKKLKQSHPELMQNALFYFPSWEHALQSAENLN
jgi:hypothetical protein